MGLSRNKVAVPEGAAGTPPFWSRRSTMQVVKIDGLDLLLLVLTVLFISRIEGAGYLFLQCRKLEASPIAQLVRAPH